VNDQREHPKAPAGMEFLAEMDGRHDSQSLRDYLHSAVNLGYGLRTAAKLVLDRAKDYWAQDKQAIAEVLRDQHKAIEALAVAQDEIADYCRYRLNDPRSRAPDGR
jgi:hypothetical protein